MLRASAIAKADNNYMNLTGHSSDERQTPSAFRGLGRFLVTLYSHGVTTAILLFCSGNILSASIRSFLGSLVLVFASIQIFASHSFQPGQLSLEGAKEWNTFFRK